MARDAAADGTSLRPDDTAAPQNPLPPESSTLHPQLWASAEVIVVPAGAGKVYVYDLPSTEPRTLQIPGGGDATSVWGFARDDLWVGSRDGRLAHYEGNGWTVSTLAQGACSTVKQLWGADQTLFFATRTTVGRIRFGQTDVILDAPCTQRTGFDPPDTFMTWAVSALDMS